MYYYFAKYNIANNRNAILKIIPVDFFRIIVYNVKASRLMTKLKLIKFFR